MSKKLTAKLLNEKKVPKVLIAGLIMASVLGWNGLPKLQNVKNYYQIRQVFPVKTAAVQIIDGDTFTIKNGLTVRLLGIDAPNRGSSDFQTSLNTLNSLIFQKPLVLEYDTYQDDKYGRILAYVWVSCEEKIQQFCRGDKALVNEIMLKTGFAKKVIYQKRKKLKYDDFLQEASSSSFPQLP